MMNDILNLNLKKNIYIGFVGAGKVGCSLGKYFQEKSLPVSGIYSKNILSAKQAADFIGIKNYSLKEIVGKSDLIFITVNDNQIKKVWKEIKDTCNYNNKIFVHTSGLHTSDLLKSKYSFAYSLHPMYAFSDKYTSYKNLSQARFSLEGNKKYLEFIKKIINNLGNEVFEIKKEKKIIYHLANVMASNFVLSILDKSFSYMEECLEDKKKVRETLAYLIKSNVNNVIENSPKIALTGVIERADTKTIKSHLKAISIEDKDLYKLLSLNLLKIAKSKNLQKIQTKKYKKVEKLLRK